MEDAERAKKAQEAILRDEGLATRVATEVARALNLPVRDYYCGTAAVGG